MEIAVCCIARNRPIFVAPCFCWRVAYAPNRSARPECRNPLFLPRWRSKDDVQVYFVERIAILLCGGIRPLGRAVLNCNPLLSTGSAAEDGNTERRGLAKRSSRDHRHSNISDHRMHGSATATEPNSFRIRQLWW